MKKTFEYLLNIPIEIEELTVFPLAEEPWAVAKKIGEGNKEYIQLLKIELTAYLYGDMKNKREELTEEQIQQLETSLKEAMKKAESRFGSFD